MLGAVPVMGMAQVGGNGGLLSFAMSELCSQIESIATEKLGAVFRVNIGDADHSFTIVVQGDKAEIVQSFAGGEGESLLTNIGGKNVYSIGEITTHLMNIEKPKGEREASANKIFGGNIMLEKGGKDLWPNVSLSWHMSTLHPAKHIFQLLAEKISLNLKALQKLGLAK